MSDEIITAELNSDSIEKLCKSAVALVQASRQNAAMQVNAIQLLTYFTIGKWIVDVQQNGEQKAKYGEQVIDRLSKRLTDEFGRGFARETIRNMRRFYIEYQERISQTVFGELCANKSQTLFTEFKQQNPFKLSWSHYLQLMRIENPDERSFYEIEAARGAWSVRTLQRQYNSSLYERIALSKDKQEVMQLANDGQVVTKPTDIIKQPTVLEFLGLEEKATYKESDLESAILDKLQKFLLEMGKGYLFEKRQRRFTFDEDDY